MLIFLCILVVFCLFAVTTGDTVLDPTGLTQLDANGYTRVACADGEDCCPGPVGCDEISCDACATTIDATFSGVITDELVCLGGNFEDSELDDWYTMKVTGAFTNATYELTRDVEESCLWVYVDEAYPVTVEFWSSLFTEGPDTLTCAPCVNDDVNCDGPFTSASCTLRIELKRLINSAGPPDCPYEWTLHAYLIVDMTGSGLGIASFTMTIFYARWTNFDTEYGTPANLVAYTGDDCTDVPTMDNHNNVISFDVWDTSGGVETLYPDPDYPETDVRSGLSGFVAADGLGGACCLLVNGIVAGIGRQGSVSFVKTS